MTDGAPDTHAKNALRAWLELTKCAKRMEGHVNRRFAEAHATSLSRFDVLANLDRCAGHVTSVSALSRMLLASRGNITRLLDRMEQDGLVRRRPSPRDARISEVKVTRAGEALFARLAHAHEAWTDGMFADLDNAELRGLVALLRTLRARLDRAPGSRL